MFILYLDCYCNEHTVKQRGFLCMKLPLELALFLVYFCYFWKVKYLLILNVSIFEYLDKILRWK